MVRTGLGAAAKAGRKDRRQALLAGGIGIALERVDHRRDLRIEIDAVDAELVRLIQHRTAISHAIGLARRKIGGPRIVYSREMAILERFRVLGPAGTDLGMLLLAMGRGKLGRK